MQQVRNENKGKTLEQNTWAKHLREQHHIKLSTIKDDGKWKRCKKCNIGSQSTKIVSHNGACRASIGLEELVSLKGEAYHEKT